MILEKNLNKLLGRLPLFYKKLHPNRLHSGKYIEGEPFDYLVIFDGITYCFDAKEQEDDLYFKEIPIHQFNDMLKAEKHGAKVFFLIYFKKEHKLKFVHPSIIMRDNRASASSDEVDNKLKTIILNFFT
jgi:penicillin-binding protein-related factor A (putative recombinase)